MLLGRVSVFGMLPRGVAGLESEEGEAGEPVRDGGVERDFCGEGESAVGSLRLRIPRWRKGDMVVVVWGGAWWTRG